MKYFKLTAIVLLVVLLSCSQDKNSESKNLIVFEQEIYNQITAMSIDAKDNLWIVQDGFRLSSYNLRGIIKSYASPVGGISSIATRKDSSVVIGGEEGIGILKNDEWTIINSQNSNLSVGPISNLYCSGGIIYVDQQDRFSIINGSNIEILLKNNNSFPNVKITEIASNSKGELILGTENSGIIVYNNTGWNVYDSIKSVWDIYVDEDDNIWFAYPTIGGIGKLKDNEYTFYYPPETINGAPYMMSITKDMNGNFWCGSTSSSWDGALFKFNIVRNEWTSVQSSSEVAEESFFPKYIAIDRKNNIWFYKGYLTLCVYNEQGIKY